MIASPPNHIDVMGFNADREFVLAAALSFEP
jgi:hypothetical protein